MHTEAAARTSQFPASSDPLSPLSATIAAASSKKGGQKLINYGCMPFHAKEGHQITVIDYGLYNLRLLVDLSD